MAGHAIRKKELYDWDDYRSWDDGRRWELIAGEAYDMSPAPGTGHQSVSSILGYEFNRAFKSQTCRVFHAPTDLKLSMRDVVQPDLMVVCDSKHIKPSHIDGAPALVVEIQSPSTAIRDRTIKMRLYADAGVRELWLVSLFPSFIDVFLLDGASYRLVGTYGKSDTLKSATFDHLKINLGMVFNLPLDSGTQDSAVHETSESYRGKKKRTRPS